MGARVVTAAALRSASGTPGRAACLAGSAPSFKGTAAALAAVERGGSGRATFSGPLVTDENVRVCGEYNAERLTGSTSVVQLAGRQAGSGSSCWATCTAGAAEEIGLRPIIARRWARPDPDALRVWDDGAHVWPSAVDQFAGVNFRTRLDA